MRNKNRERIINILFLLYLLIVFIINLFSQLENFSDITIFNIILIFIILIGTIIQNSFIIAIFIVIKVMRKREYKNQLSKIDLKNDEQYYRDILEGYSPFLLSYIDDFVFEEKRDIIATLLNLQLKKVIKIENTTILVLNPNNNNNLEESEKYILNSISNGKIKISNILELESEILKDAYNKELIQDKKILKNTNNKPEAKRYVKTFAISIIMYVLLSMLILFINSEIIITIFVFTAFIFCNPIFYVIIYIIRYYLSKPRIKRTDKGEEINIKLKGLKNYIEKYSNIKEKNANDILLWEEYLIYSIIFDINDNVVIEMNELFEK